MNHWGTNVSRKLITSCAAVVVAASALTGATAAAAVASTGETEVRVMSFNIHHGADSHDALDLERIARDIEASRADLIGLQEVDNNWSSRSGFVNQAAWLADRLDMHYAYAANLDRDPLEGQTQRRQYGTAVLSEYPILSSENHLLTNIVYAERPSEQRGLLETVINVRGNHVGFYSTHLDARRSEQRQLQVKEILALTEDSERPAVVVGDLNAREASPEVRDLLTEFTDSFDLLGQDTDYSYPTTNPTARIDYILTRGDIEPTFGEVVDTGSSDHLPVVADLTIGQAPNGLIR